MATTPVIVWGKLEMEYSAYGRPHVMRVYTGDFGVDAGVGTFVTPGSPVSLDALATELTGVIKPLYHTDSALAWGAWRGIQINDTVNGSGVPIVEGTITPASGSYNTTVNIPGAVSQMTASFRDSFGRRVKFVLLGPVYAASIPFKYSAISGGYKAYADYLLGSTRIFSRSFTSVAALIDMTFDTNDGLTRRYRR